MLFFVGNVPRAPHRPRHLYDEFSGPPDLEREIRIRLRDER
jgi:hypothetical protein